MEIIRLQPNSELNSTKSVKWEVFGIICPTKKLAQQILELQNANRYDCSANCGLEHDGVDNLGASSSALTQQMQADAMVLEPDTGRTVSSSTKEIIEEIRYCIDGMSVEFGNQVQIVLDQHQIVLDQHQIVLDQHQIILDQHQLIGEVIGAVAGLCIEAGASPEQVSQALGGYDVDDSDVIEAEVVSAEDLAALPSAPQLMLEGKQNDECFRIPLVWSWDNLYLWFYEILLRDYGTDENVNREGMDLYSIW